GQVAPRPTQSNPIAWPAPTGPASPLPLPAWRAERCCPWCPPMRVRPPPALPGDPCMTLSDPRRALLPLALALACATPAMPVLAQGLQTSFEPGEPAPAQATGALQVTIGNG